jgi:hypothetical protein
MEETAHFLNLVDDIYDVTPEPHLWIGVLEKTTLFVGGSAASILAAVIVPALRPCSCL